MRSVLGRSAVLLVGAYHSGRRSAFKIRRNLAPPGRAVGRAQPAFDQPTRTNTANIQYERALMLVKQLIVSRHQTINGLFGEYKPPNTLVVHASRRFVSRDSGSLVWLIHDRRSMDLAALHRSHHKGSYFVGGRKELDR
jgi:hypothetical protein